MKGKVLLKKGVILLGIIIMLAVYLLLGAFIVKLGIDNSKSNKYTKEILQELREIKEILRER